jgi:hypothetical protein
MRTSLEKSVLSGYVMVTCTNCNSSKNWAFSIPGAQSEGRSAYGKSLPPLVPLSSLEERPHIGYCVDVPKGVCVGHTSVWAPGEDR